MKAWIGVDFDGTLATYEKWEGPRHTGEPIAEMVERVKGWLASGVEVRIFTARCFPFMVYNIDESCSMLGGHGEANEDASYKAIVAIRNWCTKHLGQCLPVTCVKDFGMLELWDDRAVQVEANTGVVIGRSTRGFL